MRQPGRLARIVQAALRRCGVWHESGKGSAATVSAASRLRVLGREYGHDFRGSPPTLQQIRHESHVRINVMEEPFVSRAEIIQSGLAVRGFEKTMFRALAIASEAHLATPAVVRQGVRLVPAEFPLRCRIHHFAQRSVEQVA